MTKARWIIMVLIAMVSVISLQASADEYSARQARQYTQEAEYYQKKAENYRREADYYKRKAEGYQREAAYYIKKGDASRAKDYNRMASRAMDDYNTQMRYAKNADEKAADYLKRAARLLK